MSLPCTLPTITSNVVLIASSLAETVLEFATATPGYYSITVSARIILAPASLQLLREALEGGLCAQAEGYGASDRPAGTDLAPGLRIPANWGGWLPFALN